MTGYTSRFVIVLKLNMSVEPIHDYGAKATNDFGFGFS